MNAEYLERGRKKLYALFDRYKFVLLVICAGILLLALPTPERQETASDENGDGETLTLGPEDLERRLETVLSRIEGAGEVNVVLTTKSSARQILAQDGKTTERGENMESELTTVLVSKGSGNQQTVPIQQISPQYRGALVVCSGGSNAGVRLQIVEAISALTGLGADKISVCKGK